MTEQKVTSLFRQKGFTLIELLVVIGILAVLLAITLIAINPGRQFAQANNTKRRSDVNAILNAINQYAADNRGALPGSISSCTSSTPCVLTNDTTVTANLDICSVLVTQYLAALPGDPISGVAVPVTDCATTYNTGYTVFQASGGDNRITVGAPGAELTDIINVTR